MTKPVWDVYVSKLEEVARTAGELLDPSLGEDERNEVREYLKQGVRDVATIGYVLQEVRGRPSEREAAKE